jgi:membrane peptidoglycan carboxypeptidase
MLRSFPTSAVAVQAITPRGEFWFRFYPRSLRHHRTAASRQFAPLLDFSHRHGALAAAVDAQFAYHDGLVMRRIDLAQWARLLGRRSFAVRVRANYLLSAA